MKPSFRNLFIKPLPRERVLPITVLYGHATDALQAADVALVASGTATLEAAFAHFEEVGDDAEHAAAGLVGRDGDRLDVGRSVRGRPQPAARR